LVAVDDSEESRADFLRCGFTLARRRFLCLPATLILQADQNRLSRESPRRASQD
jgi:hypothetical protein